MARRDFGGERWHKDLAIMRGVRPHFSHATIAQQFWNMIAEYA